MQKNDVLLLRRIRKQSHPVHREEEKAQEARLNYARNCEKVEQKTRDYIREAKRAKAISDLDEEFNDITYASYEARKELGHARVHKQRVKALNALERQDSD